VGVARLERLGAAEEAGEWGGRGGAAAAECPVGWRRGGARAKVAGLQPASGQRAAGGGRNGEGAALRRRQEQGGARRGSGRIAGGILTTGSSSPIWLAPGGRDEWPFTNWFELQQASLDTIGAKTNSYNLFLLLGEQGGPAVLLPAFSPHFARFLPTFCPLFPPLHTVCGRTHSAAHSLRPKTVCGAQCAFNPMQLCTLLRSAPKRRGGPTSWRQAGIHLVAPLWRQENGRPTQCPAAASLLSASNT